MSTVSVVMVSYHTGPSLWLAMDSVLVEPECTELILVNNGNPPGVETLLKDSARKIPRITLITGHGNVGFAKACNLGAAKATGDYILLLNPDCMLPEGALSRALAGMARFPQNTLAGCFLANPSGSEQRGGRRGLLTLTNAVFESFGLSRILPPAERLNLTNLTMPDGAHEVPAISGAFMLLARSYYEKLQGMNEQYFLHMEDMDLCYRVHQSGGKVVFLPDVKVIHFRSTSEVSSGFVEKHKAESFIIYLNTYFKSKGSAVTIAFFAFGIRLRSLIKRGINAVNKVFEPPLYGKQKVARLVLLHHIIRFSARDTTLSGRTVLVTGAGGQLGLCVVAELLTRGAKVFGITHRTSVTFEHENLTWVERDLERSKKPLAGAQVDTVIHTAELAFLPRLLPDLCEGGTTRVIGLSCASVLEKANSTYKTERKKAKAYAEYEKILLHIGEEKGCNVTILRATAMYGAGLDSGISKQADIIKRYGVLPLPYPGQGKRQPLHVQDVAKAIMAILDTPVTYNKIYPLGGASTLTYREMLERLFEYLGKKPKFIRIPYLHALISILGSIYGLEHVNGDSVLQMSRDVVVENEMAEKDFGFRPRTFLQGDVGL